ncbi:MAG: tyrosine-type recombinase/integrase [Bacteroidetes bacterium]|nr:tyrosine-type recombinase/integrase [Bacteroidota bacterium]MCA6442539.1 tyrosine-type recombinase/integrase [Bacteroidota bacterium]
MKAKPINLKNKNIFNEYLILRGLSERTRDTIIRTVNYFAEWVKSENMELEAISYNDIVAYVNYCRKRGNKQRTILVTVNCIKHYYSLLLSENEITDNPCTNVDIKGIKRKILYETFSPPELEKIYKNYKSNNHLVHKRNKIIVGLIIYQGIRTEELAKLTVSDIKAREGKIFIAGARRHNERELTLEAHQLYDLMDYINETRKLFIALRGQDSRNLFLSMGTSERFDNIMQKLSNQLTKQDKRVKEVKQLRASVISNWLKLHDIRKVQYMAGHRYVSSTEAYQANNLDDLKEDVYRYHPDL